MAARQFIALGFCSYALGCGCPKASTVHANPPALPVDFGNGVRLSLRLRVVDDPDARGLDPSKLLQVTLENSLESKDRILVHEGLTLTGGGIRGVLQLDLRADNRTLENGCLVNASQPTTDPYIDLGPGESVTRVLELKCYHPPSATPLRAVVTYQDSGRAANLTGAEAQMLFRGPLQSNAVEFVLGGR